MSTTQQVAADLTRYGTTVATRVVAVVRRNGHRLHAEVKRRAHEPRTAPRPGDGQVGPRLMTGDYNRSIGLQHTGGINRVEAVVGTNKEQGRRLELGFHGTDALGRRYQQPPYPHFQPALDAVAPGFRADLHASTHPGSPR